MATYRAKPEDFDAVAAGADLSEKLYFLAHMDTDGDLVLAGDGEHVYGVIAEAAAENSAVTVQVAGVAKVIFGATVAEGAQVASDADGKAVTAAAGDNVIGICRKGGGTDEIGSILIDRSLVESA